MLALVLAAAFSAADLQQWIDARPDVRVYTVERASLPPPRTDAFREEPPLPRRAACRTAAGAMHAAVRLFELADRPNITLVEPEFVARNDGQQVLQLDDGAKQALVERARSYELDAGRYEPSCLG